MDPGFFASKFFAISAVAAALVVGGAASAFYLADPGGRFAWDACDAPTIAGSALAAAPASLVEDDGRRRTQTYALNASAFEGGALDLCIDVGEILVEPSAGDEVALEIVTTADVASAVEDTRVEARLHADGDRLVVAVWQATRGQSDSWFHGDSASLRVILRVPATGAYDARLVNDVGDVRLSGLMVRDPRFSTDVGNVIVRDVDAIGNVTLAADVGDAILHATSVTSGTIRLSADVGNAEANLPRRADVGYDALARTDVGDAHIAIGETDAYESEGDGAGEEESARSSGFAGKPTQVVVHASTDVGDARIVAI